MNVNENPNNIEVREGTTEEFLRLLPVDLRVERTIGMSHHEEMLVVASDLGTLFAQIEVSK
jgi:hypothetical protein